MKRYLYILLIIFTLLPLSCQEDSVEQLNRSPEIIALSAQYDSVKTLTTSLVTCRAIDPDGDSLVYWWHTAATIISDSGSSILIESPRMSCILPIACTVFDQNGGSNSDTIYVTVYGHHHQQIYTLYHKIGIRPVKYIFHSISKVG